MKTTFKLIIIGLLVFNLPVSAEKLTLCAAFEKVVASSEKKFSDLKLSEIPNQSYGKKFYSSIEISEASKTYIDDLTMSIKFKAEFGSFNSKEAAMAKVDELKKNVIACFPTVSFVTYTETLFNTTSIDFVNKSDKGLRYYKVGFRILKYGSTYDLVFECDEAEKSGWGANSELIPVYTDYFYNDKSQDNSQFSVEIRKLLTEAKSAFETIKGSEIPADFYLFTNYASKYQVSGYPGCFIEDRSMNVIFFVIPLASNLSVDNARDKRDQMFQKLQLALGTEYAYHVSSDYMKVSFIHKSRPNKELLTLLLAYKSDSYNLSILIDADK